MKKVPNPWFRHRKPIPATELFMFTGYIIGDRATIEHEFRNTMDVTIIPDAAEPIAFKDNSDGSSPYFLYYTTHFCLPD